MLKRFFCFGASSSGDATDTEWVVARPHYLPNQTLYATKKILGIVEDEVVDRFNTLKEGKKRCALGPATMRRLHRAHLPMDDSHRATSILSKLAALDNARIKAENECARLTQEVAAVTEHQRLTEFAQCRAEQLAIARGEALYRCQERLREAEEQQVQLADVLKVTLDKLGMALTPSPTAAAAHAEKRKPWEEEEHVGDKQGNQKLKKLEFGDALPMLVVPTEDVLRMHDDDDDEDNDTPMSGFTVYSNSLHSEAEEIEGGERRKPKLDKKKKKKSSGQEKQEGDSATKWKDISEAAAAAAASQMQNMQQQKLQPEQGLSVAVGGQEEMMTPMPTAAGVWAGPVAPVLLNPEAEAERLAKLIIPHLEQSQLESLVRLGANVGSPVLASPTMQLVPPLVVLIGL